MVPAVRPSLPGIRQSKRRPPYIKRWVCTHPPFRADSPRKAKIRPLQIDVSLGRTARRNICHRNPVLTHVLARPFWPQVERRCLCQSRESLGKKAHSAPDRSPANPHLRRSPRRERTYLSARRTDVFGHIIWHPASARCGDLRQIQRTLTQDARSGSVFESISGLSHASVHNRLANASRVAGRCQDSEKRAGFHKQFSDGCDVSVLNLPEGQCLS
jgi:hypothetical protein